jgi:general secretion pathway protein G
MNPSRKTRRNPFQAGFTLVEILVVIVIVGLLATLVGPNVMQALFGAQADTARTQVGEFHKTVEFYFIQEKRLPESFEDLLRDDKNGQAYLPGYSETPLDPWGNPYEINRLEGTNKFEILCWGPDGQRDTEDDLSSMRKDAK